MLMICCNKNAHKWKRSVWSVYSSYRWGGQEGGCGRTILTGWNNEYEKFDTLHRVSCSTQRLISLKYNFPVLRGQIFDIFWLYFWVFSNSICQNSWAKPVNYICLTQNVVTLLSKLKDVTASRTHAQGHGENTQSLCSVCWTSTYLISETARRR